MSVCKRLNLSNSLCLLGIPLSPGFATGTGLLGHVEELGIGNNLPVRQACQLIILHDRRTNRNLYAYVGLRQAVSHSQKSYQLLKVRGTTEIQMTPAPMQQNTPPVPAV